MVYTYLFSPGTRTEVSAGSPELDAILRHFPVFEKKYVTHDGL